MDLVKVVEEILLEPPRCGNTHVVAIDGRAGAGKTTLANDLFLALSATIPTTLIHMDEIYEGWVLALGKSLTERLSKLLEDLSRGVPHQLPIYDWNTMGFNSHRTITPTRILILEGVGSAQRIVREFAAATFWLDIDPETGLSRVLQRDGKISEPFMSQWQADEDEHHRREKTRENADFVLSTIQLF
jgi:uridine kinase